MAGSLRSCERIAVDTGLERLMVIVLLFVVLDLFAYLDFAEKPI